MQDIILPNGSEAVNPATATAYGLARAERPVVTTSFGPHSAATLHLLTRRCPDIPVIWVDTGWNSAGTYHHAERLTRDLELNLHVYTPGLTRARYEAVRNRAGVPGAGPELAAFAQEVKVAPFERALAELRPDVWFTGIRRDETDWRRRQSQVSVDASGLLKIAPFFHADDAAIERYLEAHTLPAGDRDYRDPAKGSAHRECGIHNAPRRAQPATVAAHRAP